MILTWELVAAFLAAGGAIAGAFWRVWGLIDGAKKEAIGQAASATALATLAREEVAAVRLHAAETFVTKAGMAEQTDRIMRSIEGVAEKIDRTNERLDALMLAKPAARSRTT